ncbi:MAG: glycosyltransferase family protein, partial [Acidimicrobiales bacterium]
YFPLPMGAKALHIYLITYKIAYNLVSAAGLITLPLACWALGRMARMRFPGPACLAAAALPFLFGREFTIYGGNIASTMAGEFSYYVSLSFAVLYCGLVAGGLRTGRGRVLAAVVMAACGVSHILPLLFAIAGALVFLLLELNRRRFVWLATVGVVGALLLGFWALPFELRLPYATNMGYGKITTYLATLFPAGDIWLYVIAAVGATLAFARSNLVGRWLTVMAALTAVVFRFAPSDRLWNARALPFWFLCLYLLAGVAFAEAGTGLAEAVGAWWARRAAATDPPPATAWRLLWVPVVTLLVALVWVGFPLRLLPLGTVTSNGDYSWLGITSADNSYIPDWVHWNYSGYQDAGKSGRLAYAAIIRTMRRIGATDGCGRSMYEYEPALNDMGTPDALMLLPYWTGGCITTMEGLYYESSATTPFHFLNAAELSVQPSNPMRGLDYPSAPDVGEGVRHLQMFGVRYFLAVSPSIQAQAAANPALRLLASVGPYPTALSNGTTQEQTWKVYEVQDSPLVQPLANQPVVVPGTMRTATSWLDLAQSWYLDPRRWDVYLAADGPRSWARVSAGDTSPPVHPEPSVTVTAVRVHEESLSFDVSRTGVPILVKVSYFPNWHVQGAAAVDRVTPNLMVVVPTSTHVALTYGSTPVDWVGKGLTLLGTVALVGMWRWPRRRRRHAADGPPEDPEFWGGAARTWKPAPAPSGAAGEGDKAPPGVEGRPAGPGEAAPEGRAEGRPGGLPEGSPGEG